MMQVMKVLGLLLAVLMTACGGGGGSPGVSPIGGGGGGLVGSGPTVTMELVDAAGARITGVSSAQAGFVRATVRDASGTAVAGTVVTFTGDSALVAFVPQTGTALTDASGVATIQVSPASAGSAGAATINADATVAGTAARTGTLGIQVAGAAVTVPTSLELFASSTQLSSSPNSTVSFTVVVKDAQNRAMPDQPVTFTATSGNLVGALPAPRTGANGQPVTSVSLSPGGDRANRDILLTATTASVRQTLTVAVTGTALTIVGDSSVLLGASTAMTVTARDSNGTTIPGAAISVSSSLGNSVTPAQMVTDGLGAARFTYRATNAGVDTVSASGLGASALATVAVSAEDFAFQTPAANTAVAIGAPQNMSVRLLSGGAPAAGRAVTFSTTRGSVTPASVVTDANGVASASVSSTTSGPASVVARAGTSQALLPLSFLATTPATLVLQANPGAVLPNLPGSTINQTALQATVRDSAGNPVAGRIVNFTAVQDLSNGTISPGSAVTDANGIVSVQFIPGALTTSNNGVQVQATVQGTVVSGTANLTVSGQALFISIGKGRLIGELNEPVYKKEFSVYLTDANGAPVPNKPVTLSVFADQYEKGVLRKPEGIGFTDWEMPLIRTICSNEDRDRNGILALAEDNQASGGNGNGKLDPGLPVVVTPAAVTTDAGGFATFFVQYGKNFAWWVHTTLTARATAGGTESVQTQRYSLDALKADVDLALEPPNRISPFGVITSCSDPN